MTKFSDFANTLKASDIAELLELTEKPEVISFAGGGCRHQNCSQSKK